MSQQKYEATWESLQQYTIPDWYQDAKFGIFIHWGAYAVPAFGNEWYSRHMYLQGTPEFEHHVKTYGPHTEFGYKDFIPMFKAEKYDPTQWADLFKKAGAKFVVPVAEHHDGFPLYDSDLTEWTAVKMGPKRDVIGDLADAVQNEGLIFGASSHRAEHWWFMDGGMDFDFDVQDPEYADFYGPAKPNPKTDHYSDEWKSKDWQPRPDGKFLDDWLARTCEIVDKYQPQIIWFDWWIEQIVFEPYLQKFAAYYYNRGLEWGKGVAINHKFESYPKGAAVFDIERGQLKGIRPLFWQTDTALAKKSWGYTENQDYKTVTSIIHDLVDIVSKNGALLLNVGPRADGTIPEPEVEMLLEIGRWLAVNGEAIYNTRPWQTFGEGPTQVMEGEFTDTKREAFTVQDIRFTSNGNVLYAVCLDWPGEEAVITSLGADSTVKTDMIADITMLGTSESLSWSQDEVGLKIKTPTQKSCEHAYTFKITLK